MAALNSDILLGSLNYSSKIYSFSVFFKLCFWLSLMVEIWPVLKSIVLIFDYKWPKYRSIRNGNLLEILKCHILQEGWMSQYKTPPFFLVNFPIMFCISFLKRLNKVISVGLFFTTFSKITIIFHLQDL